MIGSGAKGIGVYGFGTASHILIQITNYQGKKIFAFTGDGDCIAQSFAMELGAAWAGGSSEVPPGKIRCRDHFAPVGNLVPKALRDINKGGIVVCGGIQMSDIPSFPYDI